MNKDIINIDTITLCREHTIVGQEIESASQVGMRMKRDRKCSVCGQEFMSIEMDVRAIAIISERYEIRSLELLDVLKAHQENEMALIVERQNLRNQVAKLSILMKGGN